MDIFCQVFFYSTCTRIDSYGTFKEYNTRNWNWDYTCNVIFMNGLLFDWQSSWTVILYAFLSKSKQTIQKKFYKSTFVIKIRYRCASLFAVDTSCYFGPRILNSQIKRHILTRNLALLTIFQMRISKFADKKTADNEVHLYLGMFHKKETLARTSGSEKLCT